MVEWDIDCSSNKESTITTPYFHIRSVVNRSTCIGRGRLNMENPQNRPTTYTWTATTVVPSTTSYHAVRCHPRHALHIHIDWLWVCEFWTSTGTSHCCQHNHLIFTNGSLFKFQVACYTSPGSWGVWTGREGLVILVVPTCTTLALSVSLPSCYVNSHCSDDSGIGREVANKPAENPFIQI